MTKYEQDILDDEQVEEELADREEKRQRDADGLVESNIFEG
jgi:hypothetical protein